MADEPSILQQIREDLRVAQTMTPAEAKARDREQAAVLAKIDAENKHRRGWERDRRRRNQREPEPECSRTMPLPEPVSLRHLLPDREADRREARRQHRQTIIFGIATTTFGAVLGVVLTKAIG